MNHDNSIMLWFAFYHFLIWKQKGFMTGCMTTVYCQFIKQSVYNVNIPFIDYLHHFLLPWQIQSIHTAFCWALPSNWFLSTFLFNLTHSECVCVCPLLLPSGTQTRCYHADWSNSPCLALQSLIKWMLIVIRAGGLRWPSVRPHSWSDGIVRP